MWQTKCTADTLTADVAIKKKKENFKGHLKNAMSAFLNIKKIINQF